MKNIPKERLQEIVDEVTAMNIKGPTLEEYFEKFEDQYKSFYESFEQRKKSRD